MKLFRDNGKDTSRKWTRVVVILAIVVVLALLWVMSL